MKAVVYNQYGPPHVLQLTDIPKPRPKADELLIKIHATSVTAADCIMRQGQPVWGRAIIGWRNPRPRYRILGSEFAGEVEAIGKAVNHFQPGDQVFGFAGFGVSSYAEYKCIAETGSVAQMPSGISYEQAVAAVDGGTTALYFLQEKGEIQPGDQVLINGASGSIGTYAVQLAKQFGAEVTGVCSTRNLALVTALGADRVIDYTQEDFTQADAAYDLIFDTVGKSSFLRCYRALKRNGRYLPTTGLHNTVLQFLTKFTVNKQVRTGMSIHKREALRMLSNLIEQGKLQIVIDRTYPLAEIASAHQYVETGRKVGNVVISVVA